MSNIKLGIIREGKLPPDKRVPLIPQQCKDLLNKYSGLEIYVQPCEFRCYSDKEYEDFGIKLQEDLSNCDILMGVKEVPVEDLNAGKKYLFFSHTIKEQPYNKRLLQTILENNIQMIDYECLTGLNGFRVLGFGKYAGIVGAYNGMIAYGKKNELFDLKPAHMCRDRKEMEEQLRTIDLSGIKIVLTGEGRVAGGAKETLDVLKVRKVSPKEYLNDQFEEPVFCQLGVTEYNESLVAGDGKPPDESDFFAHPENYKSAFLPYVKVSDLLLSCHFWDPKAPVLFTKNDMRNPHFRIGVIADISCDINGSVPSTLKASSIDEPFYGYNPITEQVDAPFGNRTVTVMAVDNLPNELPRDASEDFGEGLMTHVIPHLFGEDSDGIIERGTITRDGELTENFKYLAGHVQ